MAEYINKAELVNSLDGAVIKADDGMSARDCLDVVTMLIFEHIDDMPTIDIVHCRECKHSGVDKKGWYCNKHYHRYADENTHFCSDGERGNR